MQDISRETLDDLIARARAVSQRAYSPYSGFRVGAALLTEDGDIFSGCNVENASYGLTICAERNAVFQMVAHSKRAIQAIVIYTPTETPSAPCGACRQVISEFEGDPLILCVCNGQDILSRRISELLPDPFGPKNL